MNLDEIKLDKQAQMTETEEATVQRVKTRHSVMDDARKEREDIRDKADKLKTKKSRAKYNGITDPDIPREKILVETYIWTLPSGLPISVGADGKVDGIKLELSKATLQHYITKERTIQKIKSNADRNKAWRGTMILYSGITAKTKNIPPDKKSRDPLTKEKPKQRTYYTFCPKEIDLKDVWYDEGAKNIDEVIDCIYEERIPLEEYKARFFPNDKAIEWYKYLDAVGTTEDEDKNNKKVVQLWHYFNMITAEYFIIANKKWLIYDGYYQARHGQCPFTPVQHYEVPDSLYGEGIVQRFAVCKGLIYNFLNASVNGAWLNSWGVLFAGAGTEVDDIYIESGEINIVQMTEGNASDVVPFIPNINIAQLLEMLRILEDYGIQATGLNQKAPYTSPAKTAFEAGIMKEEQNNRLKTVAESRDFGLDRAFTLTLSNILQFAPYLETQTVIDEDQNSRSDEIKIKGKKILRDGNKITGFEEAIGAEDFFKLDENIFEWLSELKVHITTPSTPNILKSLEKEDLQKYINAKVQLINLWGDPSLINIEELNRRIDMVYDIDPEHINLKTSQDALREKSAKIIEAVSSFNGGENLENNPLSNEIPNEQTIPNTNQWDWAPQGAAQGLPTDGKL